MNNAGVTHPYKPIDQITPEDWNSTIETNLSGTFYCSHEAVPLMRRRGGGYIFNISNVAALVLLPVGVTTTLPKSG